jgi:hypothetical protein
MAEFQHPAETSLVTLKVEVVFFSVTSEETQHTSLCTDPEYLHIQNALFFMFSAGLHLRL